MEQQLVQRFRALVSELGGSDDAGHQWSTKFVARYSEPQRHYHTLSHIASMFTCLGDARDKIHDHQALSLAIFFHDWVYDPTESDNEVQSMQSFEHFAAEINLRPALSDKVKHYIERTITHTLPDGKSGSHVDGDLLLFLDADLEVLARPHNEYLLYAQQIRKEYSHYEEEAYRKGRAEVLRGFLQRDRVYFSTKFADCEHTARRNMVEEIGTLEAAIGLITTI